MSQPQTEITPKSATPTATRFWVRILIGPAIFLLIQAIPMPGLKTEGHFALSCYGWVLAWWVAQPVPWGVTGFLPLLLFPLVGAMSFKDTMALYGQPVLTFLMGVMLFGYAFQKHGLARRMAVKFLSIRGVATSSRRLILVIMILSAVVSAFVDDSATIAIVLPIAIAVMKYISDEYAKRSGGTAGLPRFNAAICLSVLYGASAGGVITPAGVPFNPLAIGLLEQLTGFKISFIQWIATGFFLGLASLVIYYVVLILMSPPEIETIGGGADFFAEEKKTLGPLTQGEKNVLVVFLVMVVAWLIPAYVKVKVLDLWYVPPLGMLLLFLLPVDARQGVMTLDRKDFHNGVLWNILLLAVAGTAIASGLAKMGITDWIGQIITSSMSTAILPWAAGITTPIMSHVTSGTATTAMISTILFPLSDALGYNPAILTRIICGTALAVSFPWGGAAAGTAFASGAIRFNDMIRIGAVCTLFITIVVTLLSMLLVPALGAFTAP